MNVKALQQILIIHFLLLFTAIITVRLICRQPAFSGFQCNAGLRPYLPDFFPPRDEDKDEQIIRNANWMRLENIWEYLTEAPKRKNYEINKCHSRIVIAIIGSQRNYPSDENFRYLTQVTGEILRQIYEDRDLAFPFICNVEADPLKLVEASSLRKFVPVISPGNNYPNVTLGLRKEKLWKESEDYFGCLRAAKQICPSARGIMLVEDDAYPAPWFGRALKALSADGKHNDQNVAYVKMYHPERLRKLPWIIQMASICVVISSLITYTFAKERENKTGSPTRSVPSSYIPILVIFALQLIIWLLVGVILGHAPFSRLRIAMGQYLYLTPVESCCTPAVYFPVSSAPKVADFLEKATRERKERGEYFAKDDLLDILPAKLGMDAYQNDLDIVVHIGGHSSLRPLPGLPEA